MRRIFWTAVVLLFGFGFAMALWIGVPFVLFKMGLVTRYDVSFLRRGVAEYSRSFHLTPDALEDSHVHQRRWPVGYALARRGDTLDIDYRTMAERGSVTLVVEGVLGSTAEAWKHPFGRPPDSASAADSGRVRVEIPATALYTVRYQLTDFLGDLELRWRVE